MSVVTLPEAKMFLNINQPTYDGELQQFIDRSEKRIGKRLGAIGGTSKSERVRGLDSVLYLSYPPVASLTSVASIDGTSIPVGQLTVRGVMLEYTQWGYFPSRFYDVVYQSGYPTVDDDLKEIVLEFLRYLWDTQRGGSLKPGTRPSDPDYIDMVNKLGVDNHSSDFPPRVEQMIREYETINLR